MRGLMVLKKIKRAIREFIEAIFIILISIVMILIFGPYAIAATIWSSEDQEGDRKH